MRLSFRLDGSSVFSGPVTMCLSRCSRFRSAAWRAGVLPGCLAVTLWALTPGTSCGTAAQAPPKSDDRISLVIFAPNGPVLVDLDITVAGKPYRVWVSEFLSQRLDVDRSGGLSRQEMARVPERLVGLLGLESADATIESALAAVGGRVFPRDRAGLAAMVRHLKGGEPLMVLFDLHVRQGAILRFFNLATRTSLSPAELALRHDALLVPFYGLRQNDGIR